MKWPRRRSISGRATDLEIPLLLALFYLFHWVEPGLTTVCRAGSSFKPSGDLRGRQRQVGSLAGAAQLLNDNTGVQRLAQ